MTVRHPVALLLLFLLFPASLSYPNPDLHALLAFRTSVDPFGAALSSWDPAVDPCSGAWLGVSCSGGHVTRLVLEGLRLAGPIDALALLPTLSLLSLKNNSFSSPLHRLDFTLWRPHLKLLYLSHNRFSGPFPFGLLQLRHLHRLDLAGNLVSGGIPPEIGLLLPGLLTLRLENNLLTGGIPLSLAVVAELSDLNVSHNRLAGKIPGSLSSFPPSAFAGNLDLCGGPLSRRCFNPTARSAPMPKLGGGRRRWKWKSKWVWITAALVAGAMLTAAAVLLHRRRERIKESRGGTGETGGEREEKRRSRRRGTGEGKMEFFEGCSGEFGLDELMRGSAEMLGRGAMGSTYRVVMEGSGGEGVVVKRVRRERRRGKERRGEWTEEGLLREIGGWTHPNVVSLRAYYADDHELLLVYDYLPNGSLHNLLHGNRGPGRTPLGWTTRLKLALGAAKGLAFLHGASNSKLSHQHLTSSNILVDNEGDARISDFGLLQLLAPSFSSSNSASHIVASKTLNSSSPRGATQKCDVYSFGVILLEILTGRPAEDGDISLAQWVQTVVREEWTSEVFDTELLRNKETEDEMFALLQLALLCIAREPKDRPKMTMVYKMIEDIRDRGSRSRGSRSPSQNDHSHESSSTCPSEDAPAFACREVF
ncbi:probable leucine-rich repeat receptor-like protein kinase At1g68400 [Elaeis guineensis]|uniref:Probable leucine-rich repeat receptor-like protein kinase At1g68400 n=1 Tax=Elaeis guineensis var. tenera TaxID=51953 RepID=A0A6I9QRL3_ELAGV|nr:probable leucine-rich repeat receptor-like protein kinase At1g68400 [Elaeis guineensis]